ncbi:seminal vesicle secretory protein 6-like [Acomys russatus]|uniref:seminal vesicle secretory protein 6-like n=1 Tax=Acomys russatus TaxID=60746 RepID=UPI0021E2B43F|nr:seminal vesicle secretory protein 6-like [Acomys russatus]
MSLTSFFLLTLLLVLVTEATARKSREKFSQSEDSSESLDAKNPKTTISEEVFEERKYKANAGDGSDSNRRNEGELERSYMRKKEKQKFTQEVAK